MKDIKKMSDKELLDIIQEASDYYYNTDKLLMTDSEFDKLKDEALLRNLYVPVGSKPTGNIDAKHNYDLVGTEGKIVNKNELKEWVKLRCSQVGHIYNDDLKLRASIKYDGLSASLEIVDNKLNRAITRGDGVHGVDITHIIKQTSFKLPKFKDKYALTCEVMLTYNDYEYIKENGYAVGTNPRSMVAGILSSINPNKEACKRLVLVPLRTMTPDGIEECIDTDLFKSFSKINKTEIIGTVEEICNFYDKLANKRPDDIMIDGIVIESMDSSVRALGKYDGTRKYSIALKFPYTTMQTEVVDIRWDYNGVSGRITPVVQFKEIVYNGNTYKFASVAHYQRFNEMNLKKGSSLSWELRNDILSYINKIDDNSGEGDVIKFIDKCPCCGSDIINDGVFAYCSNKDCPEKKIGCLVNYLEKLNVKGIKENTLRLLYTNNVFTCIQDLYKDEDTLKHEMEGIDGLKEKSINNIINILKSGIYNIPEHALIGAINIPSISMTKAKLILSNFKLEDILSNILSDDYADIRDRFNNVNGLGDKTFESLRQGILNNTNLICDLLNNDKISIVSNTKENKDKDLSNLTVVITGSITQFNNRKEFVDELEKYGIKVASSVTKNTNYLICNEDKESSKSKKAKELGVIVIKEKDFIDFILNK